MHPNRETRNKPFRPTYECKRGKIHGGGAHLKLWDAVSSEPDALIRVQQGRFPQQTLDHNTGFKAVSWHIFAGHLSLAGHLTKRTRTDRDTTHATDTLFDRNLPKDLGAEALLDGLEALLQFGAAMSGKASKPIRPL